MFMDAFGMPIVFNEPAVEPIAAVTRAPDLNRQNKRDPMRDRGGGKRERSPFKEERKSREPFVGLLFDLNA